jgi:hypothetical protein
MPTLPTKGTGYVSRIGDFDHQGGRPVELPERVEGAGGVSLVLKHAYPLPSGRPFWARYQVHQGVLRVPGWRPRRVAVEVALAPWSQGRTEIGLRPARRLRLDGDRRYFDAASRAVEALVRQLETQAAAPQPEAAVSTVTRAMAGSPT